MRRDMDPVARIRAEVEGFPAHGGHVEAAGCPDEAAGYHLALLAASGYIRHGSRRHVEGLTWRGHDLCEERDETPLAGIVSARAALRWGRSARPPPAGAPPPRTVPAPAGSVGRSRRATRRGRDQRSERPG